jgi:hypothetical protein
MSNVKQVFVDPNYSNRRGKQRIEEAEKELEELMDGQVQEEPKATESKEDEPTDPEEKSFKKRYGDLRRHMAEKEKEWEERLKALEEGPTSRTNSTQTVSFVIAKHCLEQILKSKHFRG